MRQKTDRHKECAVSIPKHVTEQVIPDLITAIKGGYGGFATSYLLEELLSKFLGPDTAAADVRRERAVAKLLAMERANAKTNDRLVLFAAADRDLGWIEYGELVRRIRSVVKKVLGRLDEGEIFSSFSYTNGASTRVRRSPIAALRKLNGEAHISVGALKHWLPVICSNEYEHINAGQTLRIQQSSVLFTVPKKSDIDRVACKEPEVNALLQRAVGVYIRKRLRTAAGINLRDQSVNQKLAAEAQSRGLATIDLSSASDTISTTLVQHLLPAEWWSLLDDLRSETVLIGKREHKFNMFSSMGNGFTFELETLLFYAITRVVVESCRLDPLDISVYGDDIIAPSRAVPRLLRVLRLFGFIPNEKKTHYKGPFRESCGRHYYNGFDVTPFYIWRPVDTLPDLIRLLNRTLEWDGRGYGFMTTPSLAAFHRKYARYVPRFLWGGIEPADPYALVTGHAPRERLTPITKNVHRNSIAGVKHWLMLKSGDARDISRRLSTVNPDGVVSFLDSNVEIDPTEIVGYKASRVSKGWHTTWTPWLLSPGH